MRNHLVRPKGWMRKDRDYVMYEKGAFFSDMSVMFSQLWRCMYVPEFEDLMTRVSKALEKHDIDALRSCKEEARQLAWKYAHTQHDVKVATLLILLNAIDNPYVVESKEPDELTQKQRAHG